MRPNHHTAGHNAQKFDVFPKATIPYAEITKAQFLHFAFIQGMVSTQGYPILIKTMVSTQGYPIPIRTIVSTRASSIRRECGGAAPEGGAYTGTG